MIEYSRGGPSRRLLAGGVVLSLLFGSVAVGVLLVPSASPCHDFTATHPQSAFDITHDTATGSLRVVHDGGDRLTEANTNELAVRIKAAGAGEYATRYVLASDSSGGYPVDVGAAWTVENVTVGGRPLADGDVIRVVWTGPDDIPSVCPNYREEMATLAKDVVGDTDE